MRRRREMESEPGKKKVTLTLTLSKKARMRRKPKDKQTSAKEKSLSKEKVKAQQDAAKAEVPYIYNAPEGFCDFKDLLHGQTPDDEHLSVARTQKELYALCQMFPEAASRSMQSIIGEAGHSMKEAFESQLLRSYTLAKFSPSYKQQRVYDCKIIAGCNIRLSAVLFGSGLCLFVKELPTRAHQFPGWNTAPGRARQNIPILEYGKKCVSTREEREKEQRKHKYKKDHKGALREIGNY
ncbi:hypothetical protein Q8A73_019657 [Channa argus]|nr:hypothetical protein Q8A73_019657 [Channa argus]